MPVKNGIDAVTEIIAFDKNAKTIWVKGGSSLMFTQLFGSYLLNKKYVTRDQLKAALDFQKSLHVKLGVMAINAGYMASEQVNEIFSEILSVL